MDQKTMPDDGSAGFFAFVLGALTAAAICGLVVFATGNSFRISPGPQISALPSNQNPTLPSRK